MTDNNCALCKEPEVIMGKACQYCGYINVEDSLTEATREEGKRQVEAHRKERLSNIDEIGFFAAEMDFSGDNFETGRITKHTITLLDKQGVISNETRGHDVPVAGGYHQSVSLYKKAAGKTAQFDANIVIPPEKFLLGAKINEHLKLNLYCRPDASSGWQPEPVAKDIKLGDSLV